MEAKDPFIKNPWSRTFLLNQYRYLNPKYIKTPIDTANTPSAPSGLIKNPQENKIPNVTGVK